jgi:hypothetical protein
MGPSHYPRNKTELHDVETPIISYRWGDSFRTTSVCKVMATVFWDVKGLLLVDFIHKNETINADLYIQTLHKL